MSIVRSSGHVGSSGTNVAPALKTPSWEMGRAAVRLRRRPAMRLLSDVRSSSAPLTTPTARTSAAKLHAFLWALEKESVWRTSVLWSYQM